MDKAGAMADCLGDGSWRDWTDGQAAEVEREIDRLRRSLAAVQSLAVSWDGAADPDPYEPVTSGIVGGMRVCADELRRVISEGREMSDE